MVAWEELLMISDLINTYINKVEEYFPGEKNPDNLIFIRYEGKKVSVGKFYNCLF